MRKLSLWPLLLCMLGLSALGATVDSIPRPAKGSWSVDTTRTLSAKTLAQVNELADFANDSGEGQLFVVMVDTIDGEDSRDFATELFNRWGLGRAGRDDGVLLFVAVKDRKAEIILGDGVDEPEDIARSDKVMSERIVPAFKKGNPNAAVLEGVRGLRELLARSPLNTSTPDDEPDEAAARDAKAPAVKFEGATWWLDSTRLLTSQTRAELNKLGRETDSSGLGMLVVVVVESTRGKEARALATRAFNGSGLGHAGRNDGVLLFIAVKERKAEIILGEGVDDPEDIARSDQVMSKRILPALKKGDVNTAALQGARGLRELLARSFLNTPVPDSVKAMPRPASGSWWVDPTLALSAEVRAEVDKVARELDASGDGQLVVAVMDSAGRVAPRTLARQLINVWGVGHSGRNDGALLLFTLKDRKVELALGNSVDSPEEVTRGSALLAEQLLPTFQREGVNAAAVEGAKGLRELLALSPLNEARKASSSPVQEPQPEAQTSASNTSPAPPVPTAPPVASPPVQEEQESFPWFTTLSSGGAGLLALRGLKRRYYPSRCGSCTRRLRKLKDPEERSRFLTEGQRHEEALESVRYDVWVCKECQVHELRRFGRFLTTHQTCKACGYVTSVKLDESKEDVHLSKGKQLEEKLGSVNYDVWSCVSCQDVRIDRVANDSSAYKRCTQCDFVTVVTTNDTLVEPTYNTKGRMKVTLTCGHCGHTSSSVHDIPTKPLPPGARRCGRCQWASVRLDEAADDAHLDSGQRREESLGSVDYDVWWCESCEDVKIERNAQRSAYGKCGHCGYVTASTSSHTVATATYDRQGKVQVTTRCGHCNHESSHIRYTARLERPRPSRPVVHSESSSSSDDDSKSSGGGRSSGRGSSGSWGDDDSSSSGGGRSSGSGSSGSW